MLVSSLEVLVIANLPTFIAFNFIGLIIIAFIPRNTSFIVKNAAFTDYINIISSIHSTVVIIIVRCIFMSKKII